MYQTFEGMLQEFLTGLGEFPYAAWHESPQYQEAKLRKIQTEKNILKLIPPKQRQKADMLLDVLDCDQKAESTFYYQYGIKDGIRLLKLLGVL